VFFMV